MTYGAAHVAARRFGASEIVDPRPYAVGSIRAVFDKYPHLTDVLPAMGYGAQQVADLQATIDAVPCDLVLVGTPFDLSRLVRTKHPMLRVRYALGPEASQTLGRVLDAFIAGRGLLGVGIPAGTGTAS
jgi:predicted GTPase